MTSSEAHARPTAVDEMHQVTVEQATRRRRGDVHGVDADAAERDDLAALEPVDDALRDRPILRVEGVGVARGRHELVVGLGGDLDDLGAERGERLHLELVARALRAVGDSSWGDHLELRHVASS